MSQYAECKNYDSGLYNFSIMSFFEHFKQQFPLCNLNTVYDILMKLHTNVKHHEAICRVQEP